MQSVPKFALRRLRAAGVVTESHPDANVLTAFAEQNLANRERADVIEHLATCHDCRQVISIALPDAELLTTPAIHVSNQGVFGWPFLRWGALAAGIVIVASLGVVVQHRHPTSNVASVRESTNIPEVGASNSAESKSNVSQDGSAMHAAGVEMHSSLQGESGNTGNVTKLNPARHRSLIVPKKRQDETELTAENIPPSLIHSHSSIQNTKNLASESTPGADLTTTGIPRWVVTPSGALQRSMDAGKSWENVNPVLDTALPDGADSQFKFLVVANKGLEVWAARSGGVLFASTDGGNRWSLIAPSTDDAKLTGDVTRIEFTEQQKKIRTSTGELWVSSDDGVNWQKWQ